MALRTKWDLIDSEMQRGLRATKCDRRCSGCGVYLTTEEDFARHYVIPNERFLNLGECPNKVLNDPSILNRAVYRG